MGSALGVRKGHAARLGLTLAEYEALIAAGQKWCTSCKKWHPRSAFGSDQSRGDGLAARCLDSAIVAVGRPGARERRLQKAQGNEWCRGCSAWLAAGSVRSGVCRTHAAEDYRRYYAANPGPIRQRVYARKRNLDPIPEW